MHSENDEEDGVHGGWWDFRKLMDEVLVCVFTKTVGQYSGYVGDLRLLMRMA